jgi:DNA-directed RNA polymerase subunit RPC12/RpoP
MTKKEAVLCPYCDGENAVPSLKPSAMTQQDEIICQHCQSIFTLRETEDRRRKSA